MSTEVSVGPPRITINQGNTFLVTREDGRVEPGAELGLFSRDTRFLSTYRLSIDGLDWVPLTSAVTGYDAARLLYVSPALTTPWGAIGLREVGLLLDRRIGSALEDRIEIRNYTLHRVRIRLAIALACDFADIFEVKEHKAHLRGELDCSWSAAGRELSFHYRHGDFHRSTRFVVRESDSAPHYANGQVVFSVDLQPGAAWRALTLTVPVMGEPERKPASRLDRVGAAATGEGTGRLQKVWRDTTTRVDTPNDDVRRTFEQSVSDMGALRLYEHDEDDETWVPAAGIPWFVTLFGRDSLVASLQTMPVNNRFALGALRTLARYQADSRDDWRDMQPGKILHELRQGELAAFKLIPHTPYYGTADATILFLIVLAETWRWTGDLSILQDHKEHALRALDWIDHHGDLDADGFQEYKTYSSQGYHNMGWKDAGDALVYPDGRQVPQPIAVCELQGYVYDAKTRMAEAFEALGDHSRAARLRREAAELKERFEQAFWMEDEQFYAFALDPSKKQVKSIASNPGQLLWSGIVSPERAALVVRRLLQPDMYSGWGIRTLSAHHPAFNPFSYQRGSVWPHDNAIIALGAKRYGLADEASRIAKGIFDAAATFRGYRLPELFSGLDRETPDADGVGPEGKVAPLEGSSFPVQYLGANIPQAWAAGSVFMFLQAVLGLHADAPARRLVVSPSLPDWLPEVTLSNLHVGGARLALRFHGRGNDTRWEVVEQEGEVKVENRESTDVNRDLTGVNRR